MELPPKHVRFTHTPLNFKDKEIRLITIEPTVDPSRPIQITMRNIDFSEHIEAVTRYREVVAARNSSEWVGTEEREAIYEACFQETFDFIALSYTWGPELPVQDIFVTSSECRGWLSIRQNLYNYLKMKRDWLLVRQRIRMRKFLEVPISHYALRRSHMLKRDRGLAPIWIDQICIDQEKNEEKVHQVNQMAEIYSAAFVVEAWLCSGFEGSDDLMDMIIQESYSSRRHIPSKLFVSRQEMRKSIPLLRQFARLAYWSRLWVTQEIVLGRVVHVRVSSKILSWDTFYEGWRTLVSAWNCLRKTEQDEDLTDEEHKGCNRIYTIDRSRAMAQIDWRSVKDLIRGTVCSKWQDRVFGMMGMLDPSLRIFPDYSMLPQELLLKIVTTQVKSSHANIGNGFASRLDNSSAAYNRTHMCIFMAQQWFIILDDDDVKSRINPRSVRHHLLKTLHPDPPIFGCRIGKTWQLNIDLWLMIPNMRSIRWRFVRGGIERSIESRIREHCDIPTEIPRVFDLPVLFSEADSD